MRQNSPLVPALALAGITAIWGSTFFLIKDTVAVIPPMDFLGVRFALAGAVIGALHWRGLRAARRRTWLRGIAAGLVFAVAQIFQTFGLQRADASVSGFITGMYVVLTPLVVFFVFKKPLALRMWAAVAMSVAGLMVLSLSGFAVGLGEALTFIAAILYAVHIVLLGQWAGQEKGLDLAAVQLITLGVMFTLCALPGGVVWPTGVGGWSALVYMSIIAGLVPLIIQTWAQARIPATNAALIMTTEPVFAAFFAILLGGERLTARLVLGGALVLAAMFVSELSPRAKREGAEGGPGAALPEDDGVHEGEGMHEGETAPPGSQRRRVIDSPPSR